MTQEEISKLPQSIIAKQKSVLIEEISKYIFNACGDSRSGPGFEKGVAHRHLVEERLKIPKDTFLWDYTIEQLIFTLYFCARDL